MRFLHKFKRFLRHLYLSLHEKEYVVFYLLIIGVCILVSFVMVSALNGFEKNAPMSGGSGGEFADVMKGIYKNMNKEEKRAIRGQLDSLKRQDQTTIKKIMNQTNIKLDSP